MAGIRVKKRIFSGTVCEQQVFTAPVRCQNIKNAVPPKPRFENEEERKKHRDGISRRKFIRMINANFGPTSYYSTLTFSNEYEVHTFTEARRIRNNYFRRLTRACPNAKIVIVMGRGKGTKRIHMHMISEGVPPEIIRGKWNEGEIIDVDPLREHNYYDKKDHGQDYTGLAIYLHGHWKPEQGGHRWQATRNMKAPDVEAAKPIKREYSKTKPPRAPKGYIYIGVEETQYGCWTFKYVKEPGPDPRRRRKAS